MTAALPYAELMLLTGGRVGRHDVPCPVCGPERRSPVNRSRKVMRLWQDSDFCSFHCARCGAKGFATAGERRTADEQKLSARHAEVMEHKQAEAVRLELAKWLWRARRLVSFASSHSPSEHQPKEKTEMPIPKHIERERRRD
jgi:hypothetical protein